MFIVHVCVVYLFAGKPDSDRKPDSAAVGNLTGGGATYLNDGEQDRTAYNRMELDNRGVFF